MRPSSFLPCRSRSVALLWCHLNLPAADAFGGWVSSQWRWVSEVASTHCPLRLHQTRSGNERHPVSKHWHPSTTGNKKILKGIESWASPAEFVIGFYVEGWYCESYKYEGNCQSSGEDRLHNQRGGRQKGEEKQPARENVRAGKWLTKHSNVNNQSTLPVKSLGLVRIQ